MSRRFYVAVLEVVDTPEVDEKGNVSQPGVPVVTSCRRMGVLRKVWHRLFGKRVGSVGMFADESVIEIPCAVNAHELFDYQPENGLVCKVRKQKQAVDEEIPEV